MDTASQPKFESSSSGVNWWNIVFQILTLLGLLLVVLAIVFAVKNRRQQTSSAQTAGDDDPEVQAEIDPPSSFSLFPYGAVTLIPGFAATVAFSMSVLAHTSCEFLSFYDDRLGEPELDSLGIWYIAYVYNSDTRTYWDRTCVSYPDDIVIDASMMTARVTAILASTLGGFSMLIYLFSAASGSCGRPILRWVALPVLITAVFQMMTMLLVGTERAQGDTSLNNGGAASLTAVGYWLIAAFTMILVVPLQKGSTNHV